MLDFRVFISSPGDVALERQRAERVISRLNGEAAGLAKLTAVRWETEFYQAHETFQTQIPPSTACDIVIGILKWRLGTPLPPGFGPDPSGAPYPSGTAYELLTAIEQRRAGGQLPDVFVFRYAGGEPSVRLGDPKRADVEREWEALGGFIERWFRDKDGHFLAAFNSYKARSEPHQLTAEDDFEAQLEALLHKWLADKVAGGQLLTWPAIKGSPYRALNAFGAKHAPVFFGRARDIRLAMDLWRDYAAKGQRFLLILGASGAGKSSFARAGLIPRLVTPGVVPEVDLWRVVVTRPGDSPDGPFTSLAAALLLHEDGLPKEDEGRGPALPEIAEGDAETPGELAALLAHADGSAIKAVIKALGRVGARAQKTGRHGRDQLCHLVLLVDQLDELFAPSVAPDVRARFVDLLTALVASGRVWVLATLRDDFYPAMLKLPGLKALKEAGAAYDLAPPGAAELAEIVRAPAAAAGLAFEADPATGERLDERLLREADRPDMLPLVQLVLSRLWDSRVERDDATMLTQDAYEAVGGVKGIVAMAGDGAMAKLSAAEKVRLPPLIRQLAERAHGDGAAPSTLTIRSVPLTEAAPDAPSRALVDALVDARLLTSSSARDGRDDVRSDDGQSEAAVNLRLAHQRVLSDWPKAAAIVADSADFYRVRDEVDAQRRRWTEAGKRSDLLLGRGLHLAEARAMTEKYGAELSVATKSYVAASRRRANRVQAIGWATAVVFGIFASVAAVAAKYAFVQSTLAQQKQREAIQNLSSAKAVMSDLLYTFDESFQYMSNYTANKLIKTVLDTTNKLLAITPDDLQLLRSKINLTENYVDILVKMKEIPEAQREAENNISLARSLVVRGSSNSQSRRDLLMTLLAFGDALKASDQSKRLAAYAEAVKIARELAIEQPGDDQAQSDLAVGLSRLGQAKRQNGDHEGAIVELEEGLKVQKVISAKYPTYERAIRDLAISYYQMAVSKEAIDDNAGASIYYENGLAVIRESSKNVQDNTTVVIVEVKILRGIGLLQAKNGEIEKARATLTSALPLAAKAVSKNADQLQIKRELDAAFRTLDSRKDPSLKP